MIDVLIWMAILPSAILIYRVLRLDKVEEEPPGLLMKVFLFGALSCIPASILEAVGDSLLMNIVTSEMAYAIGMFLIVVPFSEEGVKYLAMRAVRKRPEFNYTFDGIVYGVMAILGFATLENVLYVVGLSDIGVAFARAVLSVPLHCVCGVFLGYYYGLAHRYKALGNQSQANLNRLLALFVPAIIHGIYDFSLAIDDVSVTISGLVFTLAVFLLAVRRVRLSSDRDEAFWGGFQTPVPAVQQQAYQQPQQVSTQQWQPVPEEWQPQPLQSQNTDVSSRIVSDYGQKGQIPPSPPRK